MTKYHVSLQPSVIDFWPKWDGERENFFLATITYHVHGAMKEKSTMHSIWQAAQKGLMLIKLTAFKKGKNQKAKIK